MTIFIQKGDVALDYRQAVKRGLRHFEAERMAWQREQGIVTDDPGYLAWADQWIADNAVNEANNLFNIALAGYRTAIERLARYRLADGRPAIMGVDEDGEPIELAPAIDPLPATIERPAYDPETGEPAGIEEVPNPEIVADDAERAAAQAIVDATDQAVKDYDAA